MSHIVLARCHHGLFSGIVDCPLWNIKLYQHLVPTGSFVVARFADNVMNAYAKKTGGVSMSGLGGKSIVDSPQ